MKKWFPTMALFLCVLWAVPAQAHVEIEGLPDAVAVMSYRQILYLNPGDTEARNKLAMALYRMNKLEEAKKELQFVLEKDPNNFDALDGFGVVLMKMGKYQEAGDYLQRAVKINERDPMVHVHLSAFYQKTKQAAKAKSQWKKAESLASDRSELKKMKEEFRRVTR